MNAIRATLLALVCLLAFASAGIGQTQPLAEQPAAGSPRDVQDLVRLLGDPSVQEWLKRNAVAAMPEP